MLAAAVARSSTYQLWSGDSVTNSYATTTTQKQWAWISQYRLSRLFLLGIWRSLIGWIAWYAGVGQHKISKHCSAHWSMAAFIGDIHVQLAATLRQEHNESKPETLHCLALLLYLATSRCRRLSVFCAPVTWCATVLDLSSVRSATASCTANSQQIERVEFGLDDKQDLCTAQLPDVFDTATHWITVGY